MARYILILLLFGNVLIQSQSFNIDTESPTVFSGDKKGYFGYKVVQLKADGFPWLVVSAPLEDGTPWNRTGAIYQCSYTSKTCTPIVLNNTLPISLGLTLATEEVSARGLIACGPTYSHLCEENMFLNGICYIFNDKLHVTEEIRPSYKECVSGVDAVILYDDSMSISSIDFHRMQRFMIDLIKHFQDANILFAVVQFSTQVRDVFSFQEYQQRSFNPEQEILRVRHTKGRTHTPSGIKHVVEKVFTAERGARRNTKSLLITITDGKSNDQQITFEEATRAANMKGIIRYAIGVGSEFDSARAELETIASRPENVFRVGSFSALSSIQTELAEKIFAIEGIQQTSNSSSFLLELSQGGFSAVKTPDSIVLGAVGSYDWSGGLDMIHRNASVFINVSSMSSDTRDSYLGYAVTQVVTRGKNLYVVGAPRYQHIGRVSIFHQHSSNDSWMVKQHIQGEQTGSYFGTELHSVDLNGDGSTDLVLIGAPLYHKPGTGGLVHVCILSSEANFSCEQTMRGIGGNTFGRFGAAIAALGDISSDGITDVAIGAPLEEEQHGAIYVFHGLQGGFQSKYSQRITSSLLSSGLWYFGQSLHGLLDMSGDGLTDLAVGALGHAIILRSRPLINISTSITFDPPEIPMDMVECSRMMHNKETPVVTATLCFHITSLSRGHRDLHALVNYSIQLDIARRDMEQPRLMIQNAPSDSTIVGTAETCFQKRIYAPMCLEDFLSPVQLKINFSITGNTITNSRNLRPILDPSINTTLHTKIPFQKNCGEDGICTSNLNISFLRLTELMLRPGLPLMLTMELDNLGELAYGPRLQVFHPTGLLFRRASVLQPSRVSLVCDPVGNLGNQSAWSILCIMRPPVLREQSQAIFQIIFQTLGDISWEKSIQIIVQAESENEDNSTLDDNRQNREIPVLQEVTVIIRGLESISYLNISIDKPEKRPLMHCYQLENLGNRAIPVNVTFLMPLQIEASFLWDLDRNVSVKGENTSCENSESLSMDSQDQRMQECSSPFCRMVQCKVQVLAQRAHITFCFGGFFYSNSSVQLKAQKLSMNSEAFLTINEMKYFQKPEQKFHYAKVITEVEVISPVNILPIVIGSSIGGLLLLAVVVVILYKFGFFKRKSRLENQDLADPEKPSGEQSTTADPSSPMPQETS
ncbi:integrin alpha-X [Microcaecilia unicolor]|uniref:Integrin alpha-X-like n=1 Tax=Microcaecilia unicolor TaxID=1415580 RepID=A0A6P7YSH7_9AMPH|nr:integrin alpha-X-like [Microcaecilia unicolor]